MSANQLSLSDKQDLIKKLEWAERCLDSIMKGDKPAINPALPQEQWLFDQLARLYKGHYICSPAASYVTLPGETPDDIKNKGDTRFHPIAARFVLNQKRRLIDELASASIRNFYVMGSDDKPATDVDHYVTVPSGIEALHQTLQQLLANAMGPSKLLVIQNKDDSWAPLLKFIGTDDPAVCAALHCAATEGRAATKNIILYEGKDIQKEVARSSRAAPFQDGLEILFGSTQPKKSDESAQILEHEQVKAGLRDAVVPLHWFLSADEVSKTFEGNSHEKIDSMLVRIYDQLGYEEVCNRLRARGFDPKRVVFCGNDTGVAYSEDLSAEPEFIASRSEVVPGKPWPDVELGPVVDAQGGIMRFMADVKACRARLGCTAPLRYRDTQVYMFFKLVPQREDVKIQSYFGTATGFVTLAPRPSQEGSLYTEHFHVPDGQPGGLNGRTQAELGARYLFTDSPQARCLRALVHDHQIPHSIKSIFKNSAEDRNRRSRLRLLTQDNWLPDVSRGSGGTGFARVLTSNGWKSSGKKYDAFEDFAEAADAIYLGHHGKDILKEYDKHHARLSLLFCKAGTHKQILHDVMYNKALLIVNPQLRFFSENGATHQNWSDPLMGEKFINHLKSLDPAEHPWGQQLLLYRYFHENSLIKQQPKYIWTQSEQAAIPAQLRDARDRRSGHAVTRYKKEEYGSDRTDLFSITVLGSASTRNPLYTNSSYYIGYEGARAGMHVRSGGGRYGIMGAVSRGIMDYQDANPLQADRSHLSAIQMPRTVQFEGLALDLTALHDGGNRYVAIEPGMDPRMLSLFRSDVMIADAGGLGTLEEIYYFIALKQQGHPVVQNKPLIIINHAHLGPGALRLYDPLLAVLPERDRKDIFVVPDAAAAMEMVLTFQREGYAPQKEKKIFNSQGLALSPA